MQTLTLKLNAPLQSYGTSIVLQDRNTDRYPSKSAIIGLISAAFGYRRNNPKIVELNDLQFGVRIDQPGSILSDFQTAQYRKSSQHFASKIGYRYYLQDAIFTVAISSNNDQIINDIEYALRHPKFQLYLGRRSNPIAGLFAISKYSNTPVIDVLNSISWNAARWYQKKIWYQTNQPKVSNISIITDADLGTHQTYEQAHDIVKSFSQRNRQYGYRQITKLHVDLENPYATSILRIQHDPLKCL